MIPAFNDDGYLPVGIHRATVEEIVARFGQASEVRQAQVESLGWLVDLARRAGVQRLIINGSFVTDTLEPIDVDCVLLTGPDYPQDMSAVTELQDGLPFIQMDLVGQDLFERFVNKLFATDRKAIPKGMIEVIL